MRRTTLGIGTLVFALLATQAVARATTLIQDGFQIGAPPTRGDDAADPLDAAWYGTGVAWAGGSGGIVVDGTSGSNALDFDANVDFARVFAGFPTVTLGNGGPAKLVVRFDLRVTAISAGGSPSIRFGLHADGGTPVTADGGPSSAAAGADANDQGYFALLEPDGGQAILLREPVVGPVDPVLSGSSNELLGTTSDSVQLDDLLFHDIELVVERGPGGTGLSLSADGMLLLQALDPGAGYVEFNQFAFGIGSTVVDARLDNIQVFTEAVPEPSLLALLLVGIAGIALFRRRRIS